MRYAATMSMKMMASQNGLLLPFAVYYAEKLGWHIFPIAPGTKNVALVKWGTEATCDPDKVRYWWTNRYVGANIGVACGPSGLFVLDLDVKDGKDGPFECALLELSNGLLPDTVRATTPSGGDHRFFNGTGRTTIGDKGGIAPGIDTRSYGGMVLVAPSYISNVGRYCWRTGINKFAQLPTWLEQLALRSYAPAVPQEPAVDLDQEINIAWAAHYLAHDAPPAIQGRGGEKTLLDVAGVLKDNAISEHMAVQLLFDFYNPRCEPQWSGDDAAIEDRLSAKVENAYAYLKQNAPGAGTAEAIFSADPLPPENAQQKLQDARAQIERTQTTIGGKPFPVVRTPKRKLAYVRKRKGSKS